MNGRCSIPVPRGSNGEILWNEIFIAKDRGLVWKYDRRMVKAGKKAGTKQKNGYVAVYVCGKYIGRFDTLFEAICARKSKNEEYGFHKNHGK